jgi:hypothetical protein
MYRMGFSPCVGPYRDLNNIVIEKVIEKTLLRIAQRKPKIIMCNAVGLGRVVDVRFVSKSGHWATCEECPLYPQKRTSELSRGMSALCQKRTYAVQQCGQLLDHLVGSAL